MSEKIRVLRIIARMNVGGPAIQVSNLEMHLNPGLFEHLLLTGDCELGESDFLEENNLDIKVKRISGLGRSVNLYKDFLAFVEIRRSIREFGPHIIHTHTAKAGFLGRLAALTIWHRSIKVHTFHGHLLTGYFSPFKTKLVVIAERFLAKFTDALISVGIRVRDDLLAVKIGAPEKFIVINPGLEIKVGKSRELVRNELSIPASAFVICWLGRLVQIKRPDRLIEIAQEVRNLNSNALFLCVGGGPMLSDIQERAIHSRLPIIFTGWRNDVGDLLNAADLLLLTSDNEGTPVAIIQSQMLGIPAISTDVGSVKEVLVDGKSGVAIKYDSKVFAENIVKFSQDNNLRNSFREAAIEFSGAFSIESLVKRHENLYQSLYKANQSNS